MLSDSFDYFTSSHQNFFVLNIYLIFHTRVRMKLFETAHLRGHKGEVLCVEVGEPGNWSEGLVVSGSEVRNNPL